MKYKVIIPSAKIVPEELQRIGKLPPVIYPINQRIVFDYLYENYSGQCDSMDIICYEKADKVRQRLAKYLDKNVNVIMLPELKDLGYTIYYALENVKEPVIINFADTIIMDHLTESDSFYYKEDYVSETWTYFDENNGVITDVYDKKTTSDSQKKKLFVGVFNISDTMCFRKCLEVALRANECYMNTFYYALKLYSKQYPLKAVMTEQWMDIGHAETYSNTNLEVKEREFNHISIDRNRGILTKTSENKDKFIGEIKWYLKIPSEIEYVRPRIFNYSVEYESPCVSMEYYAYHTIHELFLNSDLNRQQWSDIFTRIRFVFNDFKRFKVQGANILTSLDEMYLKKTFQRFTEIHKDKRFGRFFEESFQINEKKYYSLSRIEKILKEIVPQMLYDIKSFSIIHGDLCFANIMIDNNFSFIKLIDPRGRFGAYDIYGDARYELAKLFHSIDGKYDYIIKDMFDIQYDLEKRTIHFTILEREREFDIYQLFLDVFKSEIGEDLKKIELIEALLFLTMIPLHGEKLEHQLAMLGVGIEILNRVVDIQENGVGENVR